MQKQRVKSSLRLTVSLGMLIAISIVCGKYLAIRGGDILRFSFENLPIIFAGIAFGPISGAAVGVIADLVGCVMVGYPINPLVTVGAAAIGAVSGVGDILFGRIMHFKRSLSIAISTVSAHVVGSVIIKTFGLAVFYDMPVMVLMLWRLLNYVIVGGVECALLIILLRNKQVVKVVNEIRLEKSFAGYKGKKGKQEFANYANSFQAVTVPGLERISALCKKLGDPQDKLRFIHIAGTNGKGSTSANLACILEEAGYKTGKYISPNLIKVNERISVSGEDISDDDLDVLLRRIEPFAKEVERELGIAPTQFEIWTALAFLYFAENECDYVVLEVGLGGEFDATNLIKKNELAIITRLGLDHMQYLGDTIEEVARAKAGIIKADSRYSTVITVKQEDRAMAQLRARAEELSHKLITVDPTPMGRVGICESFSLDGMEGLECGIPGYHQIENAALAATAAKILGIPEEAIRRGIKRAKNPARFELIDNDPPTIYDGGHNENGIEALCASLERYYGDEPRTVVFACMKDKDIRGSLELLSRVDTEFIFTTVKNNPRADSAEGLRRRAAELGYGGVACETIGEAYELARSKGRLTAICGSLYLYKDLSEYLTTKGEK